MIRQLTRTLIGIPDRLGMSRRFTILLFGGIAVFSVVLSVALFWILGKSEKTARQATTEFAAALVHNDPGAAPPGAQEYVSGLRAYFGPVTGTRITRAHNRHVTTGNTADTRSFFVTELLLRTKRGPAAIELEFDNHAMFSDEVSGVHELEPDDAHGLSERDRERLEAAYEARGGKPADLLAVNPTPAAPQPTTEAHAKTQPPPEHSSARHRAAEKQLRCVQNADGDVVKMQRCARS
jgi:hypothetical protein